MWGTHRSVGRTGKGYRGTHRGVGYTQGCGGGARRARAPPQGVRNAACASGASRVRRACVARALRGSAVQRARASAGVSRVRGTCVACATGQCSVRERLRARLLACPARGARDRIERRGARLLRGEGRRGEGLRRVWPRASSCGRARVRARPRARLQARVRARLRARLRARAGLGSG